MGSIFLFTNDDPSLAPNRIYAQVHDIEMLSKPNTQDACAYFDNGGVKKCNRLGKYVTFYCYPECKPAMNVQMLRIWAEDAISPYFEKPEADTSYYDTNIDLGQMIWEGSYLSSGQNSELLITNPAGNAYLTISSLNKWEITHVLVYSETSNIDLKIYTYVSSSRRRLSSSTLCKISSVDVVLSDVSCGTSEGNVIWIENPDKLRVSKVVAFGTECGYPKLSSNQGKLDRFYSHTLL